MDYLHWDEKTITDFGDKVITEMYAAGYVFTRIGKGVMHQTRSVRIDLSKFEMSSENRRVLKKTDGIDLKNIKLPMKEYDFSIGKLAKDFYATKFGSNIMSAQKVKEMLVNTDKSNFNTLLEYKSKGTFIGATIAYLNNDILHYSYPFYDLKETQKDTGLGMMIRAIMFAKESGLKYVYLGSLQRPTDTYKLQFSGLEWLDGGPSGSGRWSSDIEKVKKMLVDLR